MIALRRHLTLFTCSLLLPLAACAPETEQEEVPAPAEEIQASPTTPPAELTSASEAYTAAWNGEDPAAIAAFFHEDAIVTEGDSTYTGRQEIIERWVTPAVAGLTGLTTTQTRAEQRGEEWYTEGAYAFKWQEPGTTDTIDVTGRYTNSWTRTPEGDWKIRSARVVQETPAPMTADSPAAAPQN